MSFEDLLAQVEMEQGELIDMPMTLETDPMEEVVPFSNHQAIKETTNKVIGFIFGDPSRLRDPLAI